jgi:integrase
MGRRPTGTVEPLRSSIRLKFTHLGTRCVETMNLAPTPANIKTAERLLARIIQAIEGGFYRRQDFFEGVGTANKETFGAYADEWLKTLTKERSTRRSYRTAINATWRPALGDMPLVQIRYSDIQKALAAKAQEVSGKTINNALIPLRGIFKTAIRDGLILKDPSEGIENQKHQAAEPDPFEPEERDAILAHMATAYPAPVLNYYEFAFFTGLRPSEQIALTWGDVDWRRRKVRVSRAIVDWEEKGTKTNKVRDVDLNDAALAALTRQKAHTFMKGVEHPIFNNPVTGKPWPDEQVQRRRYYTPALRALGLRHRDAYQTRHTFATALLMGGINPAWIAKQLGHTNTGMVFKVYTRWIDGADKGAEAARANEILSNNRPRRDAQH